MPGPSDDVLVTAAKAGDRDALDELLRRHIDRVHGICRRIARNDADALDATQEALIAITTKLDRFDGRSSFSTWVYRVATNACLDELRRRKRRPDLGLPDVERPTTGETGLSSQVTAQIVIDEGLAQLPEEFRACVVFRDLCGLDYADIADTLGIKPGTVRSRISRGRAALADAIGNQDDPDERQTP